MLSMYSGCHRQKTRYPALHLMRQWLFPRQKTMHPALHLLRQWLFSTPNELNYHNYLLQQEPHSPFLDHHSQSQETKNGDHSDNSYYQAEMSIQYLNKSVTFVIERMKKKKNYER